ncbi:MAG TPA: YceI family protein [Terracidiphilus sp.]|nr:YceI family protein [Terracidiphilus sp.]
MKSYLQVIFLSLFAALAPSAFAERQTFSVDPAASQVDFALGGSGHHVQGTFKVQSGSIAFDPAAQTISGSIVVAAGSGNSGEPSRDKKMSNDVLNVEKFSEVTFAPSSYTGSLAASGDSTIQVSGVFTLHGAAHNITVPMQVHIDGSNLTAKGQFTVPYVQWGLKDPSVFILKVAKEVEIDLSLTGHVTH